MTQYPLHQVAEIKQKRLEEAERILKEKKEALKAEEKRLEEAIQKRDRVKQTRDQKIQTFLEEAAQGISSEEVTRHKRYLKEVIDIELQQENSNVQKRQEVVKQAKKEVEIAQKEYYRKHIEVEKLQLHKAEWTKEQKLEATKKENLEQDEIGTQIHTRKRNGQ